MKKQRTLTLLLLGACTGVCQAQTNGNILVIVADDLGKELLALYDTPTTERATTPNIDKLAKRGVTFDNTYGSPLSSPARAAMLTGRYGHHTSVVNLDITLPTSEETLFEALPEGYANAAIGKWHLSKDQNFMSDYGVDHFAGFAIGGGLRSYTNWTLNINGTTTPTTEYATTTITNSAKEWIEAQESNWMCWVAYNSPHTPLHLPPAGTHTRTSLTGTADDISANSLQYLLAMTENLDYEIGRLLESIDDNTTIIFIGDNGTENGTLQSPYPTRHGKGTLYETGVAIPMVVAGRGVTKRGTRSSAMVSAVDIFPTVMELAGVTMPRYEDSFSFAKALRGGTSERKYNFSEIYNKRLGYMNTLSDGTYKIIATKGEVTSMFNLANDPLEEHNLLGETLSKRETKAFEALKAALTEMKIPEIETSGSSNSSQNRTRQNSGNNRTTMMRNRTNTNRIGTTR